MKMLPREKLLSLALPENWRRNPVFIRDLRHHTRSGSLLRQLLVRIGWSLPLGLIFHSLDRLMLGLGDPEIRAMHLNGTRSGCFILILLWVAAFEVTFRTVTAWKTKGNDEVFGGLLMSPMTSREIITGRVSAALLVAAVLQLPSLAAAGWLFSSIPASHRLAVALGLLPLTTALGSFVAFLAEAPPLDRDDRTLLEHGEPLCWLLLVFGSVAACYHLLMRSPTVPIPQLAGWSLLLTAAGALIAWGCCGYALRRLDRIRSIAVGRDSR